MSTASSPPIWRPEEIRRKQFTIRMRGLDPNEVRGFLNLLADDTQRLREQIATLRQDHSRQRDDLEQAQDELAQTRARLQQVTDEMQRAQHDQHDKVTDQAVQLLEQAQQLADALIEEGMQSARDLMMAARSHQREIVASPVEDDFEAALPRPAVSQGTESLDSDLSTDAGGLRPTSRGTQAQFRAVLDALNEQIKRLGNMSDRDEGGVSAGLTTGQSGAANGHRA